MASKKLKSIEDVCKLIEDDGILPFFVGEIANFSIAEKIASRYWFPATGDGVWEWKGPIIESGNVAYGKFYQKKACFLRLDLFAELSNWRRSRSVLTQKEEELLEILKTESSLISKEWKELGGYGSRKRERSIFDGQWIESGIEQRSARTESFDHAVTALQMGCWVVTETFEYARDKLGNPYGWGLARYTLPEVLFGEASLIVNRSPEESYAYLMDYFSKLLPRATEKEIKAILG